MNNLYRIETINMDKDCYRINIYSFNEKFNRYKFDTSIDFYKDKKDDQFIASDTHVDVSIFKYLKENNICDRTIKYPFACCYHTKCIGGDLKLTTSFLLQII